MSSTNDSYYEKFMGFFGGAKDFPAVKLYIHALNNMVMKGSYNLCDTFLCDLNSSTGAPANPKNPLPYDMEVFIHHIYKNLLSPANVTANKSAMIDAVRYVASLYDGTNYDKQIGSRLASIVIDHVDFIKSNSDDITGAPQEWKRADNLDIKIPNYGFANRGIASIIPTGSGPLIIRGPSATSGTPAPVVASSATFYYSTLASLIPYMDTKESSPDYQRILAKKVSLYNLSLHEMKQLALGHAATLAPSGKGSPASYWAPKPSSSSSTVGYYRKEADPSKLYKLVKDASTGATTETEVQPGSKYHTDIMSKPNTCNDIHGVSASNNYSCTKFVLDCLMGDKKGMDDDRCKNTLKNSSFWTNTKKEVFEDMLPDVACSVLDSFGFQKVKVTNGKYTNLNAYEEKSEWLARLNKNYSSDYDAISKNANLMTYLDMLLNKVNGSPAILNTNYYNKSSGVNTYRFNNSRLSKIGIQAINAGVNPNAVSLNNIVNVLGANISATRLAFGLSPILQPIFVMRGGSANITIQQRASQSLPSPDWANAVGKNSEILRKALEHYTSTLASVDKQIAQPDLDALNAQLDTLQQTEENLVKNVLLMHEYLNIILNYSDKYDEAAKNEALINIEAFVKSSGKRVDKIEKGTNNLVITLKKLSDALDITVNGKSI